MFGEYCATCHGTEDKGNGPAAGALKKTPADLTLLAAHNGGKFPEAHISPYIGGDVTIVAHGSRDMPIGGDVFKSMDRDQASPAMPELWRPRSIAAEVRDIRRRPEGHHCCLRDK